MSASVLRVRERGCRATSLAVFVTVPLFYIVPSIQRAWLRAFVLGLPTDPDVTD